MIEREPEVWRLCHAGDVLANLVVTESDFPWLNARLEPLAGFEALRQLFEDELRLLDVIDDQPDTWEAAQERIRATCTLRYPDGRTVPEFLLHIDEADAWWRWADEPFDDA